LTGFSSATENEWTILDESIRDDFQALARLDQGDFFIYNRDNANDTWLVGFTKDSGPVPFYTFDRKAKKGTFLFHHQPSYALPESGQSGY